MMITTVWTEDAYAKLQAYIDESMRLHKLTGAALVLEAVQLGLVDDPIVEEMATRLDPRWTWRSDEGQEWPERDQLNGEEC